MSGKKDWRDKTWTELLGTEVNFKARIAGIIDHGGEVQLVMPNGMFVYIPAEVVLGALSDE